MIVTASVHTKEQLSAVLSTALADRIYLESTLGEPEEWGALCRLVHQAGKSVYSALPAVFRDRSVKYFTSHPDALKQANFDGFLLRNTESLLFLKENDVRGQMIADHIVYAWNRAAEEVLAEFGFDALTAPIELKSTELRGLDCSVMELIIYGYMPMMVTANCLQKTTAGCDRKGGYLRLKDRQGRLMNVMKCCRYCYNVIYNSVPLSLSDRISAIRSLGPASVRLSFTGESASETEKVLALFSKAIADPGHPYLLQGPFTRGGFEHGTE